MRALQISLLSAIMSLCVAHGREDARHLPAPGDLPVADERRHINSIAKDAEGSIWAAFRGPEARLAIMDKDKWQLVEPDAFPPGLRNLGMESLPDGALACLWQEQSPPRQLVVTRHDKKKIEAMTRLPPFSEPLKAPRIVPLAGGGLLVLESGPRVIRVGKIAQDTEVFVLPEDAYLQQKSENASPSSYMPLHAVEDHHGTLWLWSACMRPDTYLRRLRGLARWKNKNLSFAELPGCSPEAPLSYVAPWRDGKLAVAVAGVKFLSLDPETGAHVEIQSGDELKFVEKVFAADGGWHLITTPRPSEVRYDVSPHFGNLIRSETERFYDPAKRTTSLLRLEGDKLEPLAWKIESEPVFGWPARPVLATREGIWLAAKNGVTFVPKSSDASSRTLGPTGVTQMLEADDKHLLALDEMGRSWLMDLLPAPASATPAPSPRVSLFTPASLLLEDSRGRLWAHNSKSVFVREKDWKELPDAVPKSALEHDMAVFVADEHDQGWIFDLDDGSAPAAVCDFQRARWHSFPSLEKALQIRMRPRSTIHVPHYRMHTVASSLTKPMKIAFLTMKAVLHYYDGHHWRRWPAASIGGEKCIVNGPPSFDEQGNLRIPLSNSLWTLTHAGNWNSRQAGEAMPSFSSSSETRPPHDCPVKNVVSAAYDRFGVCWLSDQNRRLWKFAHGRLVPVLQEGEADPLAGAGAEICEVRTGLDGAAFLRIASDFQSPRHLQVLPVSPAPQTSAQIIESTADMARLRFGDAAMHVWRVDGGEWSAATEAREHTIT
ncbi:MAG: hypothetical protein JNG86_13660, partial [Verrucomicrobiaceae bacterium]|nr:hypothetical protein [Verrucomicrobiaceae bacterium]